MGTLIGAPLGIALAAGVVLPAMVIGIPVYVGRQVNALIWRHLNLFPNVDYLLAKHEVCNREILDQTTIITAIWQQI